MSEERATPTSDVVLRDLVYAANVLQRAYALLEHTLGDSDRYYPDEATFQAAVRIKVDIKNVLDGYPRP